MATLEKSVLLVKKDEEKQLIWMYPITLSENVIHNDEQLDEVLTEMESKIAELSPDSALSSSSTHPVQNKVIYAALQGKVNTESGKGLSSNDYTTAEKNKLAGIATGANKYTHPSYTSRTSGLYKITVDATGHVSSVAAVSKSDITALGIPSENTIYEIFEGASSNADGNSGLVPQPEAGDQNKFLQGNGQWGTPPNTTYSAATQSKAGLMSAADKTKLDGIATGANKTVVDSALNSTSTNPVQNKVINAAIESVNTKLNNLIQDAPEAYDTLKEIGDYISTHKDEYSALLAITNNKVDKVSGKGLSTNDYTTTEKNKLAGIASGAEVNQNAFAVIVVGDDSITAGQKSDSIKFIAGSNVTITPDTEEGMITISATNTTYSAATQSKAGLMSAADKTKLDGIATRANNYTHPAYTARTSGLYKITVDVTGHVSTVTAVTKGDITALGIPSTNTTYSVATTDDDGLMSSEDKTKLDGIAAGANKYTHPEYTSKASGLYKITVDKTGHVSAATAVSKSDITALGIPAQDTTYTLSSFGITATATELNYMDGVTSNVQTQLNGKLSTSGTAAKATVLATSRTIDGVSFNGSANIHHYGSCSTAAGTAAKTVSCTGFTLVTGARITVKFTVTNTAASPTLNVNGTGAKAIYYNGAAISAGHLAANRTYEFVYNGTQYDLVGMVDTNTTYSTATTSSNGLMSSSDKSKLDGIASGANKYTHPSYTQRASGLYKITVDSTGHVSAVSSVAKSDITDLGIPGTNTTYSNMTGADSDTAGKAGLVPAPAAGASNRYLRSDGTWAVPPDTNTTYTLSSFGITATAAELNKLDGVTSNVQTQLNGKAASSHTHTATQVTGLTASRALVSNSSGQIAISAVTSTELGYLDGVTSSIQTQLNNKANSSHTHNYAGSSSAGGAATSAAKLNGISLTNQDLNDYHSGVNFYYGSGGNTCTNKPNGIDNFGMFVFQSAGGWYTQMLYGSDDDLYMRRWVNDSWTSWSKVYTTTNKPTASEIGAAASNHTHSQYVENLSDLGITATAAELNKLDGVTATKTEINYLDGVTSSIQTQLNGKLSTFGTAAKATADAQGQNIADTYIKSLSVSGRTITYTKGDGGTGTITTQDTNTTYSNMKGATSSAAGTAGLVPAPAAGKQTSFLRGDGTWVVPTNTTYSNMTGADSDTAGKSGLVPAPSAGASNRYLRSDGTWAVPPDTNTTYTLSSFGITATAAELNKLDGVTATATELNYVDGVTSNIQTQLNGKLSTSGTASAATKLATARSINGMSFDGTANRFNYGSCSTAAATAAKTVACTGFTLATGAEITVKFTVTNTAASPTLNVNGTGAKPIYYNGAAISAGYLKANKTYTFRYNGTQYDLVGDIDTNTTYSLSSFGVTATAAELNKLNGVTATATEINYLDGVTSAIQTQLNGKAASSHTHTATQVTGLTTSRALISNSSGQVAVSAVTSTELGYLDGVTSAIQTQLNGKAASSHSHSAATASAAGFMSASDKSKLDGIASGANKYTHPTYTTRSTNLYRFSVDSTGHVNAATAATKANIESLLAYSIDMDDTEPDSVTQDTYFFLIEDTETA